MTKKDYEKIAQAMQDAYPPNTSWVGQNDRGIAINQWMIGCEAMADHLATDNSRFDRDRFIRACEQGANVRARG